MKFFWYMICHAEENLLKVFRMDSNWNCKKIVSPFERYEVFLVHDLSRGGKFIESFQDGLKLEL